LVTLVEDAGTAPDDGGVDYVTLASKTEGYSISDLRDLVANTTQQAIIRQTGEGPVDVS
jgi:peroxin-1